MRALLILSSVFALAACQPQAEPAAAQSGSAGAVNPDANVTLYTCEDGEQVEAGYPDRETAMVKVQGRPYPMKAAVSASGVRYVGYGLQWWTKGSDATLSTLKAGEDVASDPGVKCWSGEPPGVEPPTPGAPGGLPDDRTPVSEAPFTPDSAQGAANVVQTFYAQLSVGRSAEAAKLMRNASPPDMSRYSSYNAQVGAPGSIQGAAGSLIVQVPVVVYARLKTGQEVHESGRAVLRRVNDAPGSTADQRRWRIERIELE